MFLGRYIGKTEYDYQGMDIIHNHVYPIDIIPNSCGYNWIVRIYDDSLFGKVIYKLFGTIKEKAWVPYDSYPSKYWSINNGINYSMIQIETAFPSGPSFLPRGKE